MIIAIAAVLTPTIPFNAKNSGIPMRAPIPKQINCLLVRLNKTLVFTFVKSLGMDTYAIDQPPLMRIENRLG